jgi:linoleate 10R-lipoxygenase
LQATQKAIAASEADEDAIASFFNKQTKKMIEARSFSLVGDKTKVVDVVRDVFRYVPVQWIATEVVS